jgi:hypothetical protein
MPFTEVQMSAMRIAIEKARANNPKNINNPIVNNSIESGNIFNSDIGLNNSSNYPILSDELTEPNSNGTSVVAEPNLGTPTGGSSGSTTNNTLNSEATISKKPNYLLYGGILLVVIIVYKVFSKKN